MSALLVFLSGFTWLAADPAPSATTTTATTLGVGDTLAIRALHVTEIGERPVRIDESGAVYLPLIGRVAAAGRTTRELAREIETKLDQYIREPQVSVEVTEVRSRPVSLFGSVRKPGVYQLDQTRMRLLDVLPLAGGLEPDAGSKVIVAHRDGRPNEVVTVADLLRNESGAGNSYWVGAHDTVTVPRAQLVYVLGEVRRPGGFPLKDEEKMTALQALALAEGPSMTAATRNARVIRKSGGSQPEQTVDLKSILSGKTPDFEMQPNDILFIPDSTSKRTSIRIAEAAMQMAVGAVIWRR
jgi:polysaccharide biosynthesis/export protein